MLSLEFRLAWSEDCSKKRKIRAKVDSRIYGRRRLRVMGSCGKLKKNTTTLESTETFAIDCLHSRTTSGGFVLRQQTCERENSSSREIINILTSFVTNHKQWPQWLEEQHNSTDIRKFPSEATIDIYILISRECTLTCFSNWVGEKAIAN